MGGLQVYDGYGTFSARPSATLAGNQGTYFATDLKQKYISDGTNWQEYKTEQVIDSSYDSVGGGWPATAAPYNDTNIQTIFATGHGFTATGGTGVVSDDSTNQVLGNNCVKLAVPAASSAQNGTARKTAMSALDATAKMLSFTIKCDRPDVLTSLRLDVSSDAFTNWTKFDHISPTTNLTQPLLAANEWTTINIPWASGATGGGAGATRSALTGFQIRIDTDGTAACNLWMNKIAAITEASTGICTFTFDDARDGVYAKAKAILDAKGWRACWGPIVEKIGVTNYMTLAQNQVLRQAGWEPLVHAFSTNGHNNYSTISDKDAIYDTLQAQEWMRENGFGPANNFLIPDGAFNYTGTTRNEAYRRFFNYSRLNYTRTRESYPPGKRWGLRTYSLTTTHNLADVEAKVDEAVTSKEWLIIQAHQITDSLTGDVNEWTTSDFQSLVTYIAGTNLKVKTLNEVSLSGAA